MSNIQTPVFRASYPNLFTPRAMKDNPTGPKKYSLTMLFPKGADLAALKAAAKAAAEENWGADQAKWPKNLRLPFRDQKELTQKDGVTIQDGCVEGAIFIRASGSDKKRPLVIDGNRQPLEEADFYPGCYARAIVRAFAYDQSGNRGISFGLQAVQKVKDGEPLGGGARPEDFEVVEGYGSGGDAGSASTDNVFDLG